MESSFSSRRFDIATVVLFCAALAGPVMGMFLGLGQVTPADEGRTLATLPPLSAEPKSWLQFGDGFKSYFHDRFGFRKTLIGLQAMAKRELGVSTSPEVIIGRDGWLFYAGSYAMDNYRAVRPFTERELQAYLRAYENRRDFLKKLGIAFLLVIPPEKHSIYPEFLPRSITRSGSKTRLDQLKEYFEQRSTVSLIDVRPALLTAKSMSDRKLFFKTDTHWTPYGSFIAYREIMAAARHLQPEIKEIPPSHLEVDPTPNTGDLERMLGLTASEQMENVRTGSTVMAIPKTPQISVLENSQPGLPKVMMIHDSFGVPLGGLLSQHFRRSVLISSPGAVDFNPREIQREKPDLLIVEVNERALLRDPAPAVVSYEVTERDPCDGSPVPSGTRPNRDPCGTPPWESGFQNVSQGKSATQSSPGIDPGADAGAAVDGNTNGVYYAHSVTHTGNEPNAWWQVDLGKSVDIKGIVIWNRTDCCVYRLGDYWIFVSDVPFANSDTAQSLQSRAHTWSRHEEEAPDPVSRLRTPGAKGRYVRIQIPNGPLHMAEVQVFGK